MRTALRPSFGPTLIPAKGRLEVMPPVSLEMLDASYQDYILSFDGAAKVSTRRGSCGCIQLPRWQVVKTEGHIQEGVTLAMKYDVKELVAVGDSRIVVQQAQSLINCKQPNLQRRLAEYEDLRKNFMSVKLIHVKREFNQAADYLTSKSLVLGESWELDDPDEIVNLRLVSRIPEKIMKPSEIPSTPATDAVRSDQAELGADSPDARIPESLATAAETLMENQGSPGRRSVNPAIEKVLKGDVSDLPRNQVKKIAKVSDQFVLDSREVLYRLSTPTPERPRNKQSELRLVVPETLRADM
ncbi:hypothetical protein PHMEG_00020249 [Phytophthora megakarya]|uniref:RNase H type-1 domain-containing protein n=1 Tax=Phytophthora megakarya TaxID=4795 RepID=A0A225VRD1_9STRA|nr:hypothetical protein PHMEG_00020249 [Phytophthora megakarya]